MTSLHDAIESIPFQSSDAFACAGLCHFPELPSAPSKYTIEGPETAALQIELN